MSQKEKLISFLKKYSNEDLLTSFLVINLFLPNISSPIKIQYLYVIYEEIFKSLNSSNQIKTYDDFIYFYNELIKNLPSFVMLEDYIPEQDWGEIKYFFNNYSYKIFYGADLSNVYDYYSSLEMINSGNDEKYINKIDRSFNEEFEFSLKIQDYIINNIKKSKIGKNIMPGNINLPSRTFWEEIVSFIKTNGIKRYFNKDLLDLYSFNNIEKSITEEDFQQNAFNGKNCNYFFIKYNNNYFPVIPRKYCTVIYETWASNLKYIYSEKLIAEENINFNITKNLGYFVKNRLSEDIFFEYVTPIDKNNTPLNFLFPGLIKSKNKLILLYNLSIFNNKDDISNIFKELNSIIDLLNSNGYKFLLNGTKKAIEFKNKSGTLEIFIIIPNLSTSENFSISIPKNFSGEVFTLDNFLAIIDEIIDIKQLNDFLDFINKSDKYGMGPYISQLDKFGAFIDSKGILIQGAFNPTSLFLDPHWGTEFRYRSLNNFWTNFPQHNLFGHPRNWKIEKYNEKGVVLLSKEFRGFFFCKDIGKNTFFINSLINEEIEDIEGKISEQMMNILFDELDIYKNQISNLFNLGYDLKLQTIFCSNSFLNRNINKFSYWNHLKISNDDLWRLDKVSNIKDNIFGLRIVFNEIKIIEILSSLNNRNLEIQLLYDVLKSFTDYLGINNISSDFLDLLEKDKIKKSRHGMFKIFKEASFPEYEQIITPSESDYKYVTREIAILLKDNNILPGKYNNTDSKEVVKQIRTLILKKIDNYIKEFNFNNSIPYIISKNDALHNDYFKNKNRIKGSLDHDKDYNSEEKLYEYYIEYLRNIKNYRFLIEKFIHIKPNYSKVLHEDNLKRLLALVDSFLNLQILSDIVNYGINDAGISIDDDYILDLIYPNNLSVKEKEYGVYIEKLKLGIDGNINDIPEINGNIEDFLQDLDNAFLLDFGFGLRNLINVLKVLSLWGDYKNIKDKSYYIATKSEIIGICMKNIEEINKDNIGNIIEFLLLSISNITTTRGEKGEIEQHDELPIWEYNKRIFRYTLQPLIKVKGKIMWGSYSTDKTSLLWQGITSSYKLPANFNALNIGKVLESRHIEIRKNLELKIQEILSRYTSNIHLNLNPKKLDKELSEDIGDFDIFGYIEEKNIILNIESKIIDNAYCLKDSNRVKEKIYGRVKENGIFQKGYLQKHEIRDVYVKNNYEKIFRYLNFNIPKEKPRIISLFVTITSSWWTVHPILETEVKFLEIRLLDKYLKGLLK